MRRILVINEVFQYLVERQGYYQSQTLHFAANTGNLELLEYCIAQGATTEHTKKGENVTVGENVTALHLLMPYGPSDDRIAALKALLRHGGNPLAVSSMHGYSALHFVESTAFASHLVERDFLLAREGQPFNPSAARTLLCAQNNFGHDALVTAQQDVPVIHNLENPTGEPCRTPEKRLEKEKFIRYLEGWSRSSRSFVPDGQVLDHNLSVVPNPARLDEFQRFLVGSLFRHLEQTAIGEVACVVMGYLTPVDLLSGWEQWELSAMDLPCCGDHQL
jgi:hypothetical protein